MGKYHVTMGQFRRFVAATAYQTGAEKDGKGWVWNGASAIERQEASWKNPGFKQTGDQPVVLVSWNDALEFMKWVGGQTGKAVRLPTEAEWEYACRAGTKTEYCNGNGVEALKQVGWCSYDGKWGSAGGTRTVGGFQPNAWGLYDMHGNAWQWCQDWYGDYKAEAAIDPQGPSKGDNHVLRGGSWSSNPARCRSADRIRFYPGFRNSYCCGFRVLVVFAPNGPADSAPRLESPPL
jgi:formylglycine-generating enzyme required for sulfatase activity